MLEVTNLVKIYPGVRAVDGASFSVPAGQCVGLLGPNGAGKTTTLEILEGILAPTSGQVLYDGEPLGRQFSERAGIQFQSTALQDYLTGREHLRLFRSFYDRGLSIDALVETCALEEFLDRDARKLSGGQRQRLLLAIALVNDPDIVFLDEPTTGLDPQARHNFWELVLNIRKQSKTVVLTTHYMEEAYLLCDQVVIMDHGRVIADGPPDALLAEHYRDVVIELPLDAVASLEALPVKWVERPGIARITTSELNVTLATLLSHNVPLEGLKVRPPGLEDLFLDLTGRELRI